MPATLKVIESTVALKESLEDSLGMYIVRGVYDYTFKMFQKLSRMKKSHISEKEKENFVKGSLTAIRNSLTNITDEQLIKLIRQAIQDVDSKTNK